MTTHIWRALRADGQRFWIFYDSGNLEVRLIYNFGVDLASLFMVDSRATIEDIEKEIIFRFGRSSSITEIKTPLNQLGIAHPRIWRGNECQRMDEAFHTEYSATRQGLRSLLLLLQDAFAFVEPSVSNALSYGSRFRDILILACTEVEASCRAILRANGYARSAGQLSTRDFIKLRDPLYLSNWILELAHYPTFPPISPFKDWSLDAPTQSLTWYDAYNAAKHDRETELHRATLTAAVSAVSAAAILAFAQFGLEPFSNDILFSQMKIRQIPSWNLHDEYIPPWINSSVFWRDTAWQYQSLPLV